MPHACLKRRALLPGASRGFAGLLLKDLMLSDHSNETHVIYYASLLR